MESSKEYYQGLPKKRMGAGVLLFNEKEEILIVKPTYRDYWLIPGGVVEKDESLRETCLRESQEEIGLDIDLKRLLGVHYKGDYLERGESLMFIFYGGVLTPEQIKGIELRDGEIEEYKFVKTGEALPLFSDVLRPMVFHSLEALKDNATAYSENGERKL